MLFKAYNYIIESDFDLKLPVINDGIRADVVFRECEFKKVGLKKTKIYRKGITARAAISNDILTIDWENIGSFQCQYNHILYEKKTQDDDVFRLFAVSEVLGLFLLQKGIFLLHGSSVKVGEEAIIFIGKPGAGKSTTVAAFAQAGFSVLSDDLTAISFDSDGVPYVLPAYPTIKIWEESVINLGFKKETLEPAFEGHNKFLFRQKADIFPSSPVRLKEIILLQKPYSKKNKAVEASEIPIELVKYFPLPHQYLQDKFLQNHFLNSLKIAAASIVRNMQRPRNFQLLKSFIDTFR